MTEKENKPLIDVKKGGTNFQMEDCDFEMGESERPILETKADNTRIKSTRVSTSTSNNPSYWDNWSDGKKWAMGILSALIITGAISLATVIYNGSLFSNNEIPGGTGWIFAGYYKLESKSFIEGPYVSVVSTTTRGLRKFVTLGDTIRLNVERPVVIVNYATNGTNEWEVSPTSVGKITKPHLTGTVLPAETELVVRDIKEGHWEGNPNVALWLRVVKKPK